VGKTYGRNGAKGSGEVSLDRIVRDGIELADWLRAGGTFDSAAPRTDPTPWSRHVIWGNHRLSGSALAHAAAALSGRVSWGSPVALGETADGEDTNVVWGGQCGGGDCDGVVWGTGFEGGNIVWDTATGDEHATIVSGAAVPVEDARWSAPAVMRRPADVIADAWFK
jgi:hypothetical protein